MDSDSYYQSNQELIPYRDAQKFYKSAEWGRLRNKMIMGNLNQETICPYCSVYLITISLRSINVDHILPIRKYWDLRDDEKNLQLICCCCNKRKSNQLIVDKFNEHYIRESYSFHRTWYQRNKHLFPTLGEPKWQKECPPMLGWTNNNTDTPFLKADIKTKDLIPSHPKREIFDYDPNWMEKAKIQKNNILIRHKRERHLTLKEKKERMRIEWEIFKKKYKWNNLKNNKKAQLANFFQKEFWNRINNIMIRD